MYCYFLYAMTFQQEDILGWWPPTESRRILTQEEPFTIPSDAPGLRHVVADFVTADAFDHS